MAKENRADEGEIDNRLSIISDLIVAGKTQAEIVAICLKEHAAWDVSARQIRNYTHACYSKRYVDEQLRIDRRAEARVVALQLDYIYAQSMVAMRFNVARLTRVDKIRLYKLDMPSAEYSWKQALEELGISAGDSFEDLVAVISGRAQDDGDD